MKTKPMLTKPTKSKSTTASEQAGSLNRDIKQSIYLVKVRLLVPYLKDHKSGKEFKQAGIGFSLVLADYPTVESLTSAFDHHPVMKMEPRVDTIRSLFLDGLAIWGIPNLLNFGSIKTHSVVSTWTVTGTQEGNPMLEFEAGSLIISRKVIE